MASIYTSLIKSKMKKQFNFSEIKKCTFLADYRANTLDCISYGILKNEIDIVKLKGVTLKLSDNSDKLDLFLSEVKNLITDVKEFLFIDLTFDYANNEIIKDFFYIDYQGQKQNQTIKTKI